MGVGILFLHSMGFGLICVYSICVGVGLLCKSLVRVCCSCSMPCMGVRPSFFGMFVGVVTYLKAFYWVLVLLFSRNGVVLFSSFWVLGHAFEAVIWLGGPFV